MQMYKNIVQHNEENEDQILKYLDEDERECDNLRDIVRKLLVRNPKKGLGKTSKNGNVDDIKSHCFFDIIDWEKIYNKEYTNPPKHSPMYKPKNCEFPCEPVSDLKYEKYLNTSRNDPLLLKV